MCIRDRLRELPGNVLLTTGSKELHHFAVPGLAERCYPCLLYTSVFSCQILLSLIAGCNHTLI